jgi:hypothetical protein
MNKYSIVSLLIILLGISSCELDKCKTRDITCLNKGVCFDGKCNCPITFEGDSCQFPMNKKFENIFAGKRITDDPAPNNDGPDTMYVFTEVGDNLKIRMSSVLNQLIVLRAKVAQNEFKLTDTLPAVDGYTYSGSGSLNDGFFSVTIQRDSLWLGVPQITRRYTFSGYKLN